MSSDKRRQARTQGRFSHPPDKKTNYPKVQASVVASGQTLAQDKYQYEETSGENVFQSAFEEKTKEVQLITEKCIWKELSEDSRIFYDPDFIAKKDAFKMFNELDSIIPWVVKEIMTPDGPKLQPRLVAWYGPLVYKYSSVIMQADMEWPEIVQEIKCLVESKLETMDRKITFNSVLLNKYRDGHDSVAWHSDDELSMGVHPTIASVSLGVTRKFEMAPKYDAKNERQFAPEPEYRVMLEDGSLLVMDGVMQRDWLHRVPKEYHDRGARINLTFRTVHPVRTT